MTDYMLTVYAAGTGARDVQVNRAPDMHVAIAVAEKATGCRVDHGRGGILPLFDPSIVIDYPTGDVAQLHDREARESMQIVRGARVTLPKGSEKVRA